jgi:hypothetical protein
LGAIILHNEVLLQVRHIDFLTLVEVLERTSEGEGVGVRSVATSSVAMTTVVSCVASRRRVVWLAVEGDLRALGRAGGGDVGVTGEGEEEAGCDDGMHFCFVQSWGAVVLTGIVTKLSVFLKTVDEG